MKKVIERYKKFIFIYVLVNLFALGINAIRLDARSSIGNTEFFYFSNQWGSSGNTNHFWPFVNFVEFHDNFKLYANHDNDYTSFNGIFYHYDISEFIFYIILLVTFLLYKSYIQNQKVIPIQDPKNN